MTWKSEELSLVRPERRKDLFATYIPPSFNGIRLAEIGWR